MLEDEQSMLNFLIAEENLYNNHLKNLEDIRWNRTFNLSKLQDYQNMISFLEKYRNIANNPYRTSFIATQVARMIFTFLNDLQYLLREFQFENKQKILKTITELMERAKNIIDNYYSYYKELPYPRFYEYWYSDERLKYGLPYYDVEEFWNKYYPPIKKEKTSDSDIYGAVVSEKTDYYDNRLFVPKSFRGSNGEYQQYLMLQFYKELKERKSKSQRLSVEDNDPIRKRIDEEFMKRLKPYWMR
jgi:hypothetical protein